MSFVTFAALKTLHGKAYSCVRNNKQDCPVIKGEAPSNVRIWLACIFSFCYCDLDLDPLTLTYEHALDILNIPPEGQSEVVIYHSCCYKRMKQRRKEARWQADCRNALSRYAII